MPEHVLLKNSDVEVVRESLGVLDEILQNNTFDGIVYLETSARPLFYAVDSLLTKTCSELGLPKPPQFFMLAYSTSLYNPDFSSSYYRLLDGRDAMAKRAGEILSLVKSQNPKLLIIDDYSCPPERGTVQEINQAFTSSNPNAEIHFFAFMSGVECDGSMEPVIPKCDDHFSFGVVDPKLKIDSFLVVTNGFLYREDKSRSSVGVKKPSDDYHYAEVNQEAEREKMKSLRQELRDIGNKF